MNTSRGPVNPPVSEMATDLLSPVFDTPLFSIEDIKLLAGLPDSRARAMIAELHKAGLLKYDVLGWTRKGVRRWWLTGHAPQMVDSPGPTWHDDGNRGYLLHRLPLAETFYRVAGSVEGLGKVGAFQWIADRSLDAAVRYEYGWVAILWSGFMESESHFRSRLTDLGRDLLDLAATGESPWPGMLCVVVTDWWQKELVKRAVRLLSLGPEMVSIWCIANGECPRITPYLKGRGWIHQPVRERGVGGWPWEKRIAGSIWTKPGGLVLDRILATVVEWPGMRAELGRQALGEGATGRSAQRALTRCLALGLIERRWDKDGYRYYPADRLYNILATLRDRVEPPNSKRRKGKKEERQRRLQRHEDGLMDLMGAFMAAGLPTASGRRSWEDMGKRGGGIAPDEMVRLERTPYGPTPCYVEYELSARGESRISAKLTGYMSKYRQDDWPVLVVCYNEKTESVFHEVARESNLRMLTTTLKRLSDHGPWACWSRYGLAETIG